MKINNFIAVLFVVFAALSSYSIQSADGRDIETSNIDNMSIPTAIPLLSQEQAEAANTQAQKEFFSLKEDTEPFYSYYHGQSFNMVSFEGTVRMTSSIPDPEKNDYPDCLYALLVELDSVLSSDEKQVPNELIINVPIMKRKKILEANRFLPGDKIQCTCAYYDSMPQDILEIQVSDDIESFEHMYFFSFSINRISSFSKNGVKDFAKRELTIFPIQSLPRDDRAVNLRKQRIEKEISRIEDEIKKHGGSFDAWKEEYQLIAKKYKNLCDNGWSGWINDSFFAAGAGTIQEGFETTYQTKEFIDGIMPYKRYLQKNNIDLIVLRVPSRGDFAARVLASDSFQENPLWIEHYYECLKNDIEIVDPMPEMWKARFDYPLFYYYQSKTECHPFEGAAIVSAKCIADVLSRYKYTPNEEITLKDSSVSANAILNFYPEGNNKFNPSDPVIFKGVVKDDKYISLKQNTGSPFLFVGNSYFFHPTKALGACIPGYTSFFLQTIPDFFYQQGLGNAMLRNLISNTSVLGHRKAVIMVGHPSMTWKGGFPPLPKYLMDGAKTISFFSHLDSEQIHHSIVFNEKFIPKETASGGIAICKNPDYSLYFQVDIPPVKDKSTCMLRINFIKSTLATISIVDSDNNSPLDNDIQTTLGDNISVDFFVPIDSQTRSVKIKYTLLHASYSDFSIKNIELWYY